MANVLLVGQGALEPPLPLGTISHVLIVVASAGAAHNAASNAAFRTLPKICDVTFIKLLLKNSIHGRPVHGLTAYEPCRFLMITEVCGPV
jgi:hypothetical protein